MFRHILPNAMVSALTFMPFILTGSITTLTSLDFLGFGLPPGSPSLGELLTQGKNNLQAPWLGFTGFVVIALMLSLLVFTGEAVRDAFDPRKTFALRTDAMALLEVAGPASTFGAGGRAASRRCKRRQLRRSSAARPLALVGESGSGKSVTALSILQLLPYPAGQRTPRQHPLRRPGAGRPPTTRVLRAIRGNGASA